jgi:hypothetical protein
MENVEKEVVRNRRIDQRFWEMNLELNGVSRLVWRLSLCRASSFEGCLLLKILRQIARVFGSVILTFEFGSLF